MEKMNELLFKYFRGECNEREISDIEKWYSERPENSRKYWELHEFYDAYLLNADLDLIEGRMDKLQSGTRRRRILRLAGISLSGIAAAVAVFFGAFRAAEYNMDKDMESNPVTVRVPAGQRMVLSLSDGTTVELNAGSELEYPALFRGGRRNVRLEGEALFHVSRDEEKPFTVSTFAADIHVLGTTFEVLADSRHGDFSTTLVEGSVRLESKGGTEEKYRLSPGQKASLENGRFAIARVETDKVAPWTSGIINIGDCDFRRLIDRIQAAYGVTIVISRDVMPEIDCTEGYVRISDGIDHIMDILSQLSDFEYQRDKGSGVIYIR